MNLIGTSSGQSQMNLPNEPRMYVITRKELSDSYRMVQGAHALASYALEFASLFRDWNNQYLIFLGTFLPVGLDEIKNNLIEKKIPYSTFEEPDLNDQETALCFLYHPNCNDAIDVLRIVKGLSLA